MLTKTEKSFSLIFFCILIAELICISVASLNQIHYITKPAILVALAIFFWKSSRHLSPKARNTMVFALVFSLLGDVLLMFVDRSPNFFLSGLVSFLLAHVMYILVFLKRRNQKRVASPLVFVLIIYSAGLFYLLKGGLGDMLLPVIIYMFVILTMAITASLRKGMVSGISYNLVLIGALLFMVSDSLLAVNKFYAPIPLSGISIMLSYGVAQYLIILGILKQKN